MFLNLWLDYLVCYTESWSFFLCKWVLERKFHHLMLDMPQSLLISAPLGEAFLFMGKKVIWSHPFETLLKNTLGKLWYITPFLSLVAFLNCCPLLKRFSQFCRLFFTDINLTGLITVFFIFIPLQWHHYWTKLKRNEKLEKNIKKEKVKW